MKQWLTCATSVLRAVTVKKGKTIYEGERRQKTDVRCQKTRRRKKMCEDKKRQCKSHSKALKYVPSVPKTLQTLNEGFKWRKSEKGYWVCKLYVKLVQ